MVDADRPEFCTTVLALAELRSKQLSAPALVLYWRAMCSTWTIEEFRAGAEHLLRHSQFMPTPFDFETLRRAARMTAGEAFALAVKASHSAIRNGYLTNSGTCGDPLIDRAVAALGGYAAIAMCDNDKLHFLERRFADHYEAMSDAAKIREAVPQLMRDRLRLESTPLKLLTGAKS
jgi:hypothetical protein